MHEVTINPRNPRRFADVVGSDRADTLVGMGEAAEAMLGGRSVVNVNSTAAGGGVAEMLHVLLGYATGTGVDTRWLVIEAGPDFFAVTKRIHNHLYGGPGDGGRLREAEHQLYPEARAPQAAELAATVRPGDVIVLHDPQTAGLAQHAAELGCSVVWRCHVGVDEPNEFTERGWAFLQPYLEPFVGHYVFTDRKFPPPWVPEDRCSIIWPSIDPFAPKNQPMSPETVEAILTKVGIVAGRPGDTSFIRTDGSPATVELGCDVFRTGPPAAVDTPMIVQVSRWDVMKDMDGVIEAFARHICDGRDAELVLAGPVVTAVADDPEGGEVLVKCWHAWRELPHQIRQRVQLVCLPMRDLEENAAIVNALQRHAAIVTQKSLAEGFGLTIAEAMLKGTPVIGSAVGGIVDQIIDGESGLLIQDPRDLRAFGEAASQLLDDDELRLRLGQGAERRAMATHLGDTHLEKWVDVIAAVLTDPSSP